MECVICAVNNKESSGVIVIYNGYSICDSHALYMIKNKTNVYALLVKEILGEYESDPYYSGGGPMPHETCRVDYTNGIKE